MNERVELRTLLSAMRRRARLVLAVVVLGAVGGLLVSLLTPKVYSATTSVLVGETTESSTLNPDEIKASQDLAAQYADLGLREPVLGAVTRDLALEGSWLELRERVQVNLAAGNNQLIVIEAEAGSPREALRIARTAAEQIIRLSPQRNPDPSSDFVKGQIDQLQRDIASKQQELTEIAQLQARSRSERETAQYRARTDTVIRQITNLRNNYTQLRDLVPSGRGPNSLSVLEPAAVLPSPVRPNTGVNVAVGTAVGLVFAAGLCLWLEYRRPAAGGVWPERELDGASDNEDVDSPAVRPRRLAPWSDTYVPAHGEPAEQSAAKRMLPGRLLTPDHERTGP